MFYLDPSPREIGYPTTSMMKGLEKPYYKARGGGLIDRHPALRRGDGLYRSSVSGLGRVDAASSALH